MFPTRDQSFLRHIKKPFSSNSTEDCSSRVSNSLVPVRSIDTANQLPLQPLTSFLSQDDTSASPFDIIRSYNEYWLLLPEATKTGQDRTAAIAVQETFNHVKSSIGSLPSFFLSDSSLPSIVEPNSRQQLTHQQLSTFIENFRLPLIANVADSKPVVVLALPNGYV